MGYDLTSDSGAELRFSGAGWALILNVAEAYGWTPAGTLPPEGVVAAEWEGDYDSNEGQRVESCDASELAEALLRAEQDPERSKKEAAISTDLEREIRALEIEMFGEEEVGSEPEDSEPLTIPAEVLRNLIVFLQSGGFRID